MREFQLIMLDGKEITVYEWSNVKKPIAVLQLVHGSAEHAKRYDAFAKRMNDNGIIVIANDHRGHGKTANIKKNELGFFAKKDGWKKIVDDLKIINDYAHKQWNDLPIFMLGHSMGSFMARTYAIKYSPTISGAIFMGTAEHNLVLLNFGIFVASLQQFFVGPKKPSKFIWKLSYKPLNKEFKNEKNKTGHEWLTHDKKIQEEFERDPLTKQVFTTSAFKDMFKGLKYNSKKKNYTRMRKNLPILIMAGKQDIVGNYGKMPLKVQEKFIANNYNSELKLYENSRHEILNDIEYKEVEKDIVIFIKTNLNNL